VLRKVWVPILSAATGVTATCSPPPPPFPLVDMEAQPGVEQAASGDRAGRRRRRNRGRRATGAGGPPSAGQEDNTEEGAGDFAQLASSDDGFSTAAPRPRRIIDRSASIIQQEGDLARALVVSVFGDCLDGSANAVLATIAGRFELQTSQLIIRRFGPTSFLVILPDEESAMRVFNGGRPLIAPSHRLHVRRWTRFINSTAASLPFAVEMELRGIPAHAWNLATAESLLNDFCWISDIHPETVDRRDIFRLVGWCSSLEAVPAEIDLEIIEAPVAAGDARPVKRSLVYPVTVSVVRHDPLDPASPPPPPPPADEDRRRRKRHRRRRGSPADPSLIGGTDGGAVERVPVQQRLGPVRGLCNSPGTGACINGARASSEGVSPDVVPPGDWLEEVAPSLEVEAITGKMAALRLCSMTEKDAPLVQTPRKDLVAAAAGWVPSSATSPGSVGLPPSATCTGPGDLSPGLASLDPHVVAGPSDGCPTSMFSEPALDCSQEHLDAQQKDVSSSFPSFTSVPEPRSLLSPMQRAEACQSPPGLV